MALAGRAGQPPLVAPETLPGLLQAVGGIIGQVTSQLGAEVALDPLALLGERAAAGGLARAGERSCGGATRLLRASDGWVAVSLARPDDLELIPAWLRPQDVPPDDPWDTVAELLALRPAHAAIRRAGGPASHAPAVRSLRDLVVADLSSLWAGPLCGNILSLGGARVIKVESTRRPDGTRTGPAAFFDLMHGGKDSAAFDLRTAAGVAALRELVGRADVVIEGSRPRALEQLGVAARELLRTGGPKVWLSITGHGRSGEQRHWAAFGDDAAVAGGLVVWDEAGPCFCADAVADPATGLVAAAACLGLLAQPGRWLVDVPMAGVAAWLAGDADRRPSLRAGPDGSVATGTGRVRVAPPRARPVTEPGPALGADTSRVLGDLRAGRLRGGRG